MKFSKIDFNIRFKRLLLKGVAISLIVLGILISIENITKFTKNYSAYETDNRSFDSDYGSKESKTDILEINNTSIKSNKIEIIKEPVLYHNRPETGDEIGEVYIPKLEATLPIYEGTSEEELDLGVGHYAESVLPGEKDNSVLSGHRDTVFRNLGKVGEGDSLIVRTSAGEFEYKVNKVRIVDKDDLTVIVPKPRATLTISTCYPFTYIGSAPKRYILVANLISQTLY